MKLHPLDWLVIGIYAATIAGIGLRLTRKNQSSEEYFLAGRQLRWPFIGASLFAANISSEHFVGLAGSGYSDGMAVGGFEWMAVYCLMPLIFLFLPFYIKNRIFTVPEFLERRFSPSVRLIFSGFMIILAVLTKLSISFWASSLVFSNMLGWNKTSVIWTVGLATALYTMKGGLRVVVYTDAIQTVILILAAAALTALGLQHVGGWTRLHTQLPPEMFHMIKPATDANYPWPGMLVGVFLLGSFYWSMDQVLVQRAFSAKSLNEGRLGAVFCGFLKLSTPFLLVLPGLIARVLYPKLSRPDEAYPRMLADLMPTGLLGLTVAGIIAALMGHISATYNSVATLFTRDFYLRWRPEATQQTQIAVGRIALLVTFVLGALWAPMIGNFGNLFIYLQTVQAYLLMPIAGIFFVGVLWKGTTSAGVLSCLGAAAVLCPLFLFDSYAHFLPFMKVPLLRPWLHSAMVACAACMVVLAGVSLCTQPIEASRLRTTTISYSGDTLAQRVLTNPSPGIFQDYRFWVAVLVLLTSGMWSLMR
jgi:SSS family solute:Na+ symporter